MAKRFGRVRTYSDWIKPKLVTNALELLDKEIPKYKNQIKFVHLCFMTDPFMYKHKEVQDMTLKVIEKLAKNDVKCTVLTKGIYPDVLTNKKIYGSNNEYGITLVSLDEKFKKVYEPFSAPYMERIESLKKLHKKGLKTWVSIEPYPTPNMVKQDLKDILERLYFVDKIVFGKMNYNSKVSQYEGYEKFYEECAEIVAEFCELSNKAYHIKFGTSRKYGKRSENLFKKRIPLSQEINDVKQKKECLRTCSA
jgi:DNA repair photolyase